MIDLVIDGLLKEEVAEDVAGDLRDDGIDGERGGVVDGTDREDLSAGGCIEDYHFGTSVIRIKSSSEKLCIGW